MYHYIEKLYWKGFENVNDIDSGQFGGYYSHLEKVLSKGLERLCREKSRPVPELSREMLGAFTEQMRLMTLRALIFEMHVSERCGELIGQTGREKYKYYADVLLRSPAYLSDLYGEYPCMYQCILRSLENHLRSLDKMLDRFEGDREELNQKFSWKVPCKAVRKINGGSSDSHNGGARVYKLDLDNGETLVYKPRNLAIDEAYSTFLKWICRNLDVEYWWPDLWNRDSYGWSGWVTELSCTSDGQLRRYYQRNGILLCLAHLLGSEDLHYENVIAHGEYPVIVDLEMGIGSRMLSADTDKGTKTERIYRESILHTGLLPLYTLNEEGEGINVGAMNGEGGQLVPLMSPCIAQPGDVAMHVTYRHPMMEEKQNLARLNGKFVQPYAFAEEIIKGFEETYHFLDKNREQVKSKLTLFENVKIRYLLRSTQEYSMMLMISYHPEYMTGSAAREKILYQMSCGGTAKGSEKRKWGVEQETEELQRDDIPYFWYFMREKELHSGTQKIYKNYFHTTALQGIRQRLERLSDEDLSRQKKFIKASLLLGTKTTEKMSRKISSAQKQPQKIGSKKKIMAADKIGELLLEQAIWSEDKKDIGWISFTMAGYRERGYLIRPMNRYLYGGTAGVAVFMALLTKKTGKERYQEASSVLINQLFWHTDELSETEDDNPRSTGAFSGEASIAYAYQLLYSHEKRTVFLEYMHRQCQAVANLLRYDKNYDVLGGNAGAVLVLIRAYELTGEKQYLNWAGEAGEDLLEKGHRYDWGMGWINPSTKNALSGFAHGSSGIMLAFAKLGYYLKNEKYNHAAYEAYRFEQHYFDAAADDWEDLRFSGDEEMLESQTMAWCHGWGGIIMSRVLTEKYVDGEFKAILRESVPFVNNKNPDYEDGKGYSLCHGKCGNAALLYAIGDKAKADTWLDRIVEECLSNQEDLREILDLQECENYGLMSGITGIGYGCLCGAEGILQLLGVSDEENKM